jgi:hypothetical protein
MTKPGPWRCDHCRLELGRVTRSNDLIVTARPAMIDVGRIATVVRCPACGEPKAFSGRRVVVDNPASPMAA